MGRLNVIKLPVVMYYHLVYTSIVALSADFFISLRETKILQKGSHTGTPNSEISVIRGSKPYQSPLRMYTVYNVINHPLADGQLTIS